MAIDTKEKKLEKIINTAFRAMLNGTSDMIFVKDADLVYVAASAPFVEMTGKRTAEDLLYRTDLEIFENDELARRYIADDKKLMASGENLLDYIEPITDDNGHARYGCTSKYILKDVDGDVLGILGITRDITREYIVRQYYQQELKYLFELPADTYAVSYIDVDSWRIVSQRRQRIGEGTLQTCYSVEELCQAAWESIVDAESDAARFYRSCSKDFLQRMYKSGKSELSFVYQRRLSDGSVHWVQNHIRFLIDADSGHICAMFSAKDIDEEKQEEQKLLEAAQLDRMTMLLNRETTMERIRAALAENAEKKHALFMLDIDNFKRLNDTMGHQEGDSFLIALAKELREHFTDADIVGRIGGDEFFMLKRDVSGAEEACSKAQEVLGGIQKVCAAYADISLSGSIGVSIYPECGSTLELLYAQADSALYQAKGNGKNQFILSV